MYADEVKEMTVLERIVGWRKELVLRDKELTERIAMLDSQLTETRKEQMVVRQAIEGLAPTETATPATWDGR